MGGRSFWEFLGLQRDHTEKEMMRAILEGICFNLKRILTGVCSEDQLTEIRATGGFSQSPVFRQLMADVLGYPLIFPAVSEASALGAVFLGWQSIGKITDLSEAIEKSTACFTSTSSTNGQRDISKNLSDFC